MQGKGSAGMAVQDGYCDAGRRWDVNGKLALYASYK
jgi:hypothetical protein